MTQQTDMNKVLDASIKAFQCFRKTSPAKRSELMHRIADRLENESQHLVPIAQKETNLGQKRLESELKRTAWQLRSYANFMSTGLALDIRISSGQSDTTPPVAPLYKMNVAIGPVAVFGSSNFPFAYSTAGGDTACALAAGCSVIVKAHPAHLQTSRAVANLIIDTLASENFTSHIFQHIEGGFETGEALVKHPLLAAVGFTGSLSGGKQLFDWGQQRNTPIPVFSEMGSINPVFFLPGKLNKEAASISEKMVQSISQDAGQFCTNPGVMVAIESSGLQEFRNQLKNSIRSLRPFPMLHKGIFERFTAGKEKVRRLSGIHLLAHSETDAKDGEADITVVETDASFFLSHQELRDEVFGSFSILVVCKNRDEMLEVARSFQGQLTASVFATDEEFIAYDALIQILQDKCGRFISNGVPTGVRVASAMQHGGPFPATSDPRFSSVGGDGIRRFMRPVCYQNWSDKLLPPELQKNNPYQLWRMIDDKWVR